MRKAVLIGGIVALAAILSVVTLQVVSNATNKPTTPQTASETVKPPTVDELLTLVNAERAKVGVAPLVLDPLLSQSAQLKSNDLLANHYIEHVNPSTGKRGITYIEDVGVRCTWLSENLTDNIYVNDSSHAINAWMSSQSHREAMLDNRYETTGFGIAGTKIVQHFCDVN